jgi:hypothetical protein
MQNEEFSKVAGFKYFILGAFAPDTGESASGELRSTEEIKGRVQFLSTFLFVHSPTESLLTVNDDQTFTAFLLLAPLFLLHKITQVWSGPVELRTLVQACCMMLMGGHGINHSNAYLDHVVQPVGTAGQPQPPCACPRGPCPGPPAGTLGGCGQHPVLRGSQRLNTLLDPCNGEDSTEGRLAFSLKSA